MRWYEMIFTWLDGLEMKLSFAFFAAFMSSHFGANEYLLVLVQYLFLADFIIGIIDATKRKKFSWARMWSGIRKVTSLYFAVLVVGFGTRAFDVAITHTIDIEYNGKFFFNLFLYVLIVFELASVNRHLARLDFAVNKQLDTFLHDNKGMINGKVQGLFAKFFHIDKVHVDKKQDESECFIKEENHKR